MWQTRKMGEVVEIQRGTTITKKQTRDGSIPVIAGGQQPAYYHDTANYTGKTITVSGSGAYAGFVNFFDQPIFASDCSTIKAKNSGTLDMVYLYYFLKSKQRDIYALQVGTGQPHVYPRDLINITIPLPPIEEQKHIIAVLEEAFVEIDMSRALSERKIESLRELRQSTLQKHLTPPQQQGDAVMWEVKVISEICQINPSKGEARKLLEGDDLVSFVPMHDMGSSEKYLFAQKVKKLEEVVSSYTYFADNDVLLAKITPCFENGKLGIARNLKNGIGFGSSEFFVLRCGGHLDSGYLYYFLSQDDFKKLGQATMKGAAGHQRVSKDFIENYFIPLPLLEEQKRIVATLDEAFTGIDKMLSLEESKLNCLDELRQSTFQKAFTG
ncbi:MAG: restriction endonuclease subunit S [Alphaproteobacteria bacterium]